MADLSDARTNIANAITHIRNSAWQNARVEIAKAQATLLGVPDSASGGESLRIRDKAKDLLDTIDRLERSASKDAQSKRVVFSKPRL